MTTFQGQQVPVEELSKHIRYETLDPRWKEEKRQADLNRAASAVMPGGTDVSASLRSIAAHRPDIFGGNIGEAERQRQAEQMAKSKAREKQVWDGHAASKDSITLRYQQTANLDEQIAALHKAKGVLATEESNIGPSIPTNVTQSAPVEQTTLSSGASISAAPQPAQVTVERTTSQNFLSTGIPSGFASPGGASPAPVTPNPAQQPPAAPLPAGLPARPPVAAPGDAVPGSRAPSAPAEPATGGTTRPLPDTFDTSEPSAKRARRTDGHVYPEEDWLAAHPDPVRIKVQLPDYPEKPAWGCKGQQVELEVPLTLLIGTVRDRISVRPEPTSLPITPVFER